MKKAIITLSFLAGMLGAVAQNNNPNPFPKTITVTGSAEMEIIPDEIYVSIELREYQKKGEDKKDIETIKSNFLEACRRTGLPDSAISIVSYTGFNNYYYWRKKKKTPEMLAGITYQVKFNDSRLMDNLVEQLDDEATQNFSITRTSHSKITAFRKELKIKAVQAAKEKGSYLTEAIGEKLGEAITINEPNEHEASDYRSNQMAYSQVQLKDRNVSGDKQTEIDFKKLKYRYEVTIVFALK